MLTAVITMDMTQHRTIRQAFVQYTHDTTFLVFCFGLGLMPNNAKRSPGCVADSPHTPIIFLIVVGDRVRGSRGP